MHEVRSTMDGELTFPADPSPSAGLFPNPTPELKGRFLMSRPNFKPQHPEHAAGATRTMPRRLPNAELRSREYCPPAKSIN
jgi:hypothetical protein